MIRNPLAPACTLCLAGLLLAAPAAAQEAAPAASAALPSETPAQLVPSSEGFDNVRSEVMIPMRDGVRLFTVILVPNGAAGAPILLTRTPYGADALTRHAASSRLGPVLAGLRSISLFLRSLLKNGPFSILTGC